MWDEVVRKLLDEAAALADQGISLQRRGLLYLAYSYYHSASVVYGIAVDVASGRVSSDVELELLAVETVIKNAIQRAKRVEGNGGQKLSGAPNVENTPKSVLEDAERILSTA